MRGLIQQLLASDHGAEKTAQRLFAKAVQHTQQRRAKSSQLLAWKLMWDADEIAGELEWLLRDEMNGINLLEPVQYQRILTAIYGWHPRLAASAQAVALQRCGFVQNGLLALLPQLKRHQQLAQLCWGYRQHLVLTAAQQIKSQGQSLALVPAIAITSPCLPLLSSLKVDVNLLKIRKKIQAVSDLQRTLSTRQDIDSQYRSFKQVFATNRVIIETERDSAALTFVKAVATVISVGLAALLGIWGVKGHKTVQQIDHILQSPVSPGSV